MPATLHLSPKISDSLCYEVIYALSGVRVNDGTRDRAGYLRDAIARNETPGLEHSMTPIRNLVKRGFKGLPQSLSYGVLPAEFLRTYIENNHPDVAAYNRYFREGLGEFKADDYASSNNLTLWGSAGSTDESVHVRAILDRHEAAAKISGTARRQITAVFWRES